MKLAKTLFGAIAISWTAIFLAACMDQDPFGRSKRVVTGKYLLEQFEGGVYYLQKEGNLQQGGGLLEGTVDEIGWTNGIIVARRTAIFRGDPDGWMIIHVRSDKIQGPLSEQEFRTNYPNLRTASPQQAWDTL